MVLILLVAVIAIYWLRPHSKFLLTIIPPSNLYNQVAKQPITLGINNSSKNLQLTHSYIGTYLVGVYIKSPPPFGTPIESNAVLSLSVRNNDQLLFEDKFTRWASRFGGPGGKESGVILGYYKVPEDVPLWAAVHATLSIDTPDPTFEKKYGDVEFFIQRKSDQ